MKLVNLSLIKGTIKLGSYIFTSIRTYTHSSSRLGAIKNEFASNLVKLLLPKSLLVKMNDSRKTINKLITVSLPTFHLSIRQRENICHCHAMKTRLK